VRAVEPAQTPPEDRASIAVQAIVDRPGEAAWRIEHDPASTGAVETGGASGEVAYRFGLAAGAPSGQYTALVHDLPADTTPGDRADPAADHARSWSADPAADPASSLQAGHVRTVSTM